MQQNNRPSHTPSIQKGKMDSESGDSGQITNHLMPLVYINPVPILSLTVLYDSIQNQLLGFTLAS